MGNLHAVEAAGLMHGEHVGLLDPARIDALMRLHRRERGQTVAVDGGALEIERGGGLLHLRRQLVLHRLALARERRVRFAHQLAVFDEIDLARARTGAALDLIQQARARAALEESVGTRTQQKGALQRRDRAVDRPDRGERAVIIALAGARAAMLEDLRRPVVGGDQDMGKRLVVAQQHVEARAQALDQVGFEQKRLGLGRGRDELERRGRRDHAFDAGVVAGRAAIGDDPFADVLGLADVEHVALGIDHAIDAGRGRRELGVTRDHRAADGERADGGEVEVLFRLGQRLLLVLLEEFARGIDVVLAAVHAAKVRRRRGRGHPARTEACAQRGVLARALRPSAGNDPPHSACRIRFAPFGLRGCPLSDGGFAPARPIFKVF